MFESSAIALADLRGLLAQLATLGAAVDDGERVDLLEALERLKAGCAAAQARVTADLVESQEHIAEEWRKYARRAADDGDFSTWRIAREKAAAASCPEAEEHDSGVWDGDARRTGRERPTWRGKRGRITGSLIGVAGQVALARRESPSNGSRCVRTALALVHQMPHVLRLLERGELSERRAALVVQEVAVLSHEQRVAVDAELRSTLGDDVGRLGDRELRGRVQAIAYRLDPKSVLARAAHASEERRVTIRPAPDTMCYLTAMLPVAQGVAAHAALTRAADTARAAGDERSKGQVMADTLVTRLTGQSAADVLPVEVQLVMTDRALFSGDATPAVLPGYGTIPAALARRLLARTHVAGAGEGQPEVARVWLRRLYTHPADGTLVTMDASRRGFDGPLRAFLIARDGMCRTPWCDAPVRHLDHVVDHARGGPTSAENGQGLCVRCNLIKLQLGWSSQPVKPPDGQWRPHTVEITTPTGHRYRSTAPPVLTEDPELSPSALEREYERQLAAA